MTDDMMVSLIIEDTVSEAQRELSDRILHTFEIIDERNSELPDKTALALHIQRQAAQLVEVSSGSEVRDSTWKHNLDMLVAGVIATKLILYRKEISKMMG